MPNFKHIPLRKRLIPGKTFFHFFLVLITSLILPACSSDEWIPIYDGQEQLTFKHYLGIPDASIPNLDLKKDSLGNYLEGFGLKDPLHVYSISQVDDEHVIRLSGQIVGGLILKDSLANYHLRLKFKWGDVKWEWMKGRPKDGGILYHQRPRIRHELQIHEGDVGSYWAKHVQLDIPARLTNQLPEAITLARPYLQEYVSTLRDTMLQFDPEAPLHHFEGKNEWQIVLANPYNERPHGEWNTLEVICWQNHAVHLVNGQINLVLLNSFYEEEGQVKPLIDGRLTLQSEGAEVFFKDIYYKEVRETPEVLKRYLE